MLNWFLDYAEGLPSTLNLEPGTMKPKATLLKGFRVWVKGLGARRGSRGVNMGT